MGFTRYKKPLNNLVWKELIEWGLDENSIVSEGQLYALILSNIKCSCDVVQMASLNSNSLSLIPKIVMQKYGCSNFAIFKKGLTNTDSPDLFNIQNWRVRTGVGDNFI